jgi:2-methylisocitrate lyase-like PEP mutase family enzyme
MTVLNPRVAEFRRLHESGHFVMPNPWDVGSAIILEKLGFSALATTSAGFAWTLGRRDYGATVDEALAHCATIAGAVKVPVNADFERAFATDPEEVATNVARACETGIAGLSVEDSTREREHPLFDFALAVNRIRAARRAIDESGSGVVLTARSEGFVAGLPDIGETVRRLRAYADAGADCLFAPGIRTPADIEAVVRAVAPKPVNVVVNADFTTVDQLVALGVRRISVGGTFARTALTAFLAAAKEVAEHGTFSAFGQTLTGAEIDRLFV